MTPSGGGLEALGEKSEIDFGPAAISATDEINHSIPQGFRAAYWFRALGSRFQMSSGMLAQTLTLESDLPAAFLSEVLSSQV